MTAIIAMITMKATAPRDPPIITADWFAAELGTYLSVSVQSILSRQVPHNFER